MPPYDPLESASPETRQRYEQARARRKSKEAEFRVKIPSASLRALEEKEYQAQQAWVRWEYSPEEWARLDQLDWRPRRRACFWGLMGLLPFGLGLFLLTVSGTAVAGVLAFVSLALVVLFFSGSFTRQKQHNVTRPDSSRLSLVE